MKLDRSGRLPGPLGLSGGPFLARGWESDTQHWPLVQGQDVKDSFFAELLIIRGCWGCGKLLSHL